MFVCSVILVNHPFETDFAGKRLFLQKNDVLLADDVSKSLFLHHPGNVTELRIDECIVRKYLESADRIQFSDTPVPVPFIKTSFTLPSLLHDIVINLSRHNTLPQQFSEQMFFACLSIFSTHRGFMPMLFKCINSVALKVGYIICSSPSRAWKIKDISNALYMSESLLKRKLREEKTSFSQANKNGSREYLFLSGNSSFVSIYIDGRDCCQTGQFSQDVADGALTFK